ncbi:hypothetical protein EG68_07158 [Paragonimus skrjabini miyazakii]|uniref:Secreted protein n=1 Tax=Paragonimus skrjabini miyazakii TaxID=59628 RepID=A0A8S9YRA1_9TREM|nr:hypothetical protein EG68_07158 [Paragonimus skrjabini miyazakii]
MNASSFLIMVTCIWGIGFGQSVKPTIYLLNSQTDNMDVRNQLTSRDPTGWSQGTFSNLILLDDNGHTSKFEITVNSSKYPKLLPNEMLWRINLEITGPNEHCLTRAEHFVPTAKCSHAVQTSWHLSLLFEKVGQRNT